MKGIVAFLLILTLAAGVLLPVSAASDPVGKLVSEMSLRDKVTQMLMVDFCYWDQAPTAETERTGFTVMNDQVRGIVEEYNFGAVIYFFQNLAGTEQAFHLTMAMQEAAAKDGGLPMLIAADQEGGSVYRLATGTALPGNMALGAAADTEYARLSGRIIGSELSALGINTNLAPVVDVNNNPSNPVIGLRAYSDNPTVVGQMASAMVEGMAQFQVVGCAKHFPGHGDTAVDSHYGLPCVDKSLDELMSCELVPYRIAIDQGVEMIMTAHILYPQLEGEKVVSLKTGKAEALPATMSPKIVTGLLKQELGFEGIVVTDAMNMAGIADYWDPVQAVVLAIQAGVDMVCMPCSLHSPEDIAQLDAILEGVMEAVEKGAIPMERIDDAVTRILTVKKNRGILDWSAEEYALEKALVVVGGEANREAERHIAASAVTVVENKNDTLPLRVTSETKCLMLVPYENERAQMLLGWNRAVQAGLIPEGAQVQVARFSRNTTLDTYLSEIDWADTLIFNSEISQTSHMNGGGWESAYILRVLDYAESQGKTTIVQSVDKPYDVQSYPGADAVLAVYGCKGSSLDPTEVLLGGATGGEAAYGPNIVAGIEVILGMFPTKGTLPVDIPRYENGAFTQEILYHRGYGLQYESLLPEFVFIPETTEAIQIETAAATESAAPKPAETGEKEQTGSLLPLIPAFLGAAAAGSILLLHRKNKRK